MNLARRQALLTVVALGGPGSGCTGPNCGRPKGHDGEHSTDDGKIQPDPEIIGTPRTPPIKVKTVGEAIGHILKGNNVEMYDTKSVHTVVRELANMAQEAKRLGKDAPKYDLCQVSLAGSNVFCGEGLKTKEYPNGVPRLHMPQLGGVPNPGSEADKLPRNPFDKKAVDGSEHFIKHLEKRGIKVVKEKEHAATLRASQRELEGAKVAAMMTHATFDPGSTPVFVSRDNYVVDGHHRWAAVVGRDAEDGNFNTSMPVIRVDANISEVLKMANDWSKEFGIKQAGVPK